MKQEEKEEKYYLALRQVRFLPAASDSCPLHFKQEIYNTIDGMLKDQLAEATIKETVRKLKMMSKECNLNNPDNVLVYLAKKASKSEGNYTETLANCYNRYTRYNGLKWEMPFFKRKSQPPYVPTTEEITILISNSGTKYCMIFSILRDTGMRPIELVRCKLKWLDLKRGLIRVMTAKYGAGRNLKLKPRTLQMLEEYLAKNNFELNDNIFPSSTALRSNIIRIRQRTAKKLRMPELNKICLYSFRHYFAVKLYRDSKHDYWLVNKKLGHKTMERTMTYLQSLSLDIEEVDFDTRTAETAEEALELGKDGWTKYDEFEGKHLYRKPK